MTDSQRLMNRIPDRSVCAILLAAGSSTRMGENKMLMRFYGKTPIELCIDAFFKYADEFVIVVSDSTREEALSAAKRLLEGRGKSVKLVNGGKRRQDSVYNALKAASSDIVAIHDCARCCVSDALPSHPCPYRCRPSPQRGWSTHIVFVPSG